MRSAVRSAINPHKINQSTKGENMTTAQFSCKGFDPANHNPNFSGDGGFQNLVPTQYLPAVTRILESIGATEVGYLDPSSGYSALLVPVGKDPLKHEELRIVWGLNHSTGDKFVGILIDPIQWLYSHKLDPAVIDVRERWTDV